MDASQVPTALAAAAGRFGLGKVLDAPEPLAQAWSNEVFRVRTETGRYAVKLFSRDLGTAVETGMATEQAALDTGEIPMATPVPDPETGSWLAEIQTPVGSRRGRSHRWARCHHWIDGQACTEAAPTAAIARDVGRTLGILHGLRIPGGDTGALDPVDLARWRRAVASAARAGTTWAEDLAALTPLVEERAGEIDALRGERRPMWTSHRDLDPKNAVVRPDGRVAITDWDYAGPVLAEVELVVAATSFAGEAPGPDRDLVAEFVSAYRAAGGNAGPADDLSLTSEAADVGWLLRNVEGFCDPAPGDDPAVRDRTARDLIGAYASGADTLRRWSRFVTDQSRTCRGDR